MTLLVCNAAQNVQRRRWGFEEKMAKTLPNSRYCLPRPCGEGKTLLANFGDSLGRAGYLFERPAFSRSNASSSLRSCSCSRKIKGLSENFSFLSFAKRSAVKAVSLG